jgi:SAM-dependent methyltransferase
MTSSMETLRRTWEELGQHDPLWAVVTSDGTRGGRWNVDEFLATGERDVERYHSLLRRHAEAPPRLGKVLDFGCGVGRLSRAWSRRADHVIGVDIAAPMVQKGRLLLGASTNVELTVNERSDLQTFSDSEFDLVCSHICLQHMPWSLAAGYVREFGRVARPNGLVAFQLPARLGRGVDMSTLRRRLVDNLPLGLGSLYRRWRRGYSAVFEMHCTPMETVLGVARESRLKFLHADQDHSAGSGIESFIYVFRKVAADRSAAR